LEPDPILEYEGKDDFEPRAAGQQWNDELFILFENVVDVDDVGFIAIAPHIVELLSE